MITDKESEYIKTHAYLPEHVIGYVAAVSGGEPYLFKDYLCYRKNDTLIFVGYPFKKSFDEKNMKKVLDAAVREFKPGRIALIEPKILLKDICYLERNTDEYYRLDLNNYTISQKVRNMISRAQRELLIDQKNNCSDEHKNLISEFLNSHKVSEETKFIFGKIPEYISSSETAFILDARDKHDRLVAFDVVEFGSIDYAFYMFNVTSRQNYVSGASDLLFYELINTAKEKRFINLGLGINEGVRFFKRKWGGVPFLPYNFLLYEVNQKIALETLFQKL